MSLASCPWLTRESLCIRRSLHPLQQDKAPNVVCWWRAALPEHATFSAAGAGCEGALGLISAAHCATSEPAGHASGE